MKNLKLGIAALAIILSVTSAFTSKSTLAVKYWFELDNTTYTGRQQEPADEVDYLTDHETAYNFSESQPSGYTPFENGYDTNPASGTATVIYAKLK